jgi:hypothetical protein
MGVEWSGELLGEANSLWMNLVSQLMQVNWKLRLVESILIRGIDVST